MNGLRHKYFSVEKYRSSRPEVFCRKGVLRNFAKFTGKHLCQSLFFNKETLALVFSCKFCEISKNTFFTEHLWTTAIKKEALAQVFSCEFSEISKNTHSTEHLRATASESSV